MDSQIRQDGSWTDRRKGYQYCGVLFSEKGTELNLSGVQYRELPFPASANKRFRVWLAVCLLFVFPGIPLLAYWGWNQHLLWIGAIFGILSYWLHGRIHRCHGCGEKSRPLSTPYMNSPVLYLCSRCHAFFEHGHIDGGWPWK